MPLGPEPHTAESLAQAQPKVGQLVLHSGRDDRKNRAHYETVRLHLAKRLGQHLLAYASDQFTDAGEAQPAVLAKHFEGKHRPLIGDPSDDLADQRLQFGVILLRRFGVHPMVRGCFGDVSHGYTLP